MKSTVLAAAALIALGLAAPVQAAPGGMAKDVGAAAPDAAIDLVRHGGPSCSLGQRGWHYHSRRGERIECSPRPRGVFYSWRTEGNRSGWYHRGYRRWY
jgi:hypothetical protein